MREYTLNECCKYLASRDIEESGGRSRSVRRIKAERAIAKATLKGLDLGYRGIRLRLYVLRHARAEVGFDILTWLMIISILTNVMRIAIDWWHRRQALN